MRRKTATVILVVFFFVGFGLLLYPTVSNWYNSFHMSHVVISHEQTVEKLNDETYQQTLDAARARNEALLESGIIWEPTGYATGYATEQEKKEYDKMLVAYNKLLNVSGDGVMATIDIPKIDEELPIYHGTSEKVLQVGIGHIPGSSLPIGGEGTHCLLSGHRGMPNARLFTDLQLLEKGDRFTITTMREVLTYEVDGMNTIEPYDISPFKILEGEDSCTLITCTPYGINTHRYIVHAHRVKTEEAKEIILPADALQLEPRLVAIVIAAPMLLALIAVLLWKTRKNTGRDPRSLPYEA